MTVGAYQSSDLPTPGHIVNLDNGDSIFYPGSGSRGSFELVIQTKVPFVFHASDTGISGKPLRSAHSVRVESARLNERVPMERSDCIGDMYITFRRTNNYHAFENYAQPNEYPQVPSLNTSANLDTSLSASRKSKNETSKVSFKNGLDVTPGKQQKEIDGKPRSNVTTPSSSFAKTSIKMTRLVKPVKIITTSSWREEKKVAATDNDKCMKENVNPTKANIIDENVSPVNESDSPVVSESESPSSNPSIEALPRPDSSEYDACSESADVDSNKSDEARHSKSHEKVTLLINGSSSEGVSGCTSTNSNCIPSDAIPESTRQRKNDQISSSVCHNGNATCTNFMNVIKGTDLCGASFNLVICPNSNLKESKKNVASRKCTLVSSESERSSSDSQKCRHCKQNGHSLRVSNCFGI